MVQVHDWDAIVVGSGATGGVVAKELTQGGLRVLLLEAGRDADPVSDIDLRDPWQREHGEKNPRQSIQSLQHCYDQKNKHLFVDDEDNPYSTDQDKPFQWTRSRILGGRTNLWGKVCFRMGDWDFQAASRDGYGLNWPFAYEELKPYYEKVESYIGVQASQDLIDFLPDGGKVPAPLSGSVESFLRERFRKNWPEREVILARLAKRGSSSSGSHPYSSFPGTTSTGSTLLAAISTGNLTVRANTIVTRIVHDKFSGKAVGVEFVDSLTKSEGELRAKIVILCASTIESVRIMLNSRSATFPNGIGNNEGNLGCYLMDHTARFCFGHFSKSLMPDYVPSLGKEHLYVPNFRNLRGKKEDFLRGYGMMLDVQHTDSKQDSLKFCAITFGEVLAKKENRITLHPARVDCWGIPIAHINLEYSENEKLLYQDSMRTYQEMMERLNFFSEDMGPVFPIPGTSVHEVGGARMGTNPKTSVLNSFNQCWESKNLFVVDGSCFVSSGTQNPTLTMMAIASRASDFILRECSRLNIR